MRLRVSARAEGGITGPSRTRAPIAGDVPEEGQEFRAPMPNVDHARHEVRLKLVYYGPGLGGKTTNLEFIHRHSRPNLRGKLVTLNDAAERTLFFDLLPVELGTFRGYTVRVHLCTVPGQIAHDRVRQLVLRHVDGIVMVVDSQRERAQQN